jgi:6-phosphogluconolactonase
MSCPSSSKPDWLNIVPDLAALNRTAADEFVRCARAAIDQHGRFAVALSGGNTPRSIYSLIASEYKSAVAWDKVSVFFGDERHVPPDSPESNYRMANESLLSHVPIPRQNIFRVQAELEAQNAAANYDAELQDFFKLKPGEWPCFDLILLGMGDDGHTASLFPGTAALKETSRLVVANRVEQLKTERITFTLPVLNHAAEVMVLVAGANKADVLGRICHSDGAYPVQMVRPERGRLLWIVEQQAARLI